MSKESICERERSQLSKMNKFQLGNQFKKVGYSIAIAAFILMLGRKFIENSEWIKPILHGVLLIGLLVISLSKEKMRQKRQDLQVIFQDPLASLNPRMTVGNIIAEPLVTFFPSATQIAVTFPSASGKSNAFWSVSTEP